MPRKTDSNNPADWLWISASDLEGLQTLAHAEHGYSLCRSKLAEVIEKIIKAELIRCGWKLRKTHDLSELADELAALSPELSPSVNRLCDDFAQVYFTDRYPGFEMEDEDWPALRAQVAEVGRLLATVQARL